MHSLRNVVFLLVIVLASFFATAVEERNPYAEFRMKTYEIQEAYLKRVTDHQVLVMRDLEDKLDQQKWQTTVVSVMVVVMVCFGLVLSALQFYSDFKSKGKSSVTIKVGSGSFELNSTVIGLAILAMSFWFFQTYVEKVYNVNVFTIPPIDVTTFGINN